MEENSTVVRGENLVKTFKDFWGRDKVKALRGVDIEIPKGSVFGLLGPNGAGKSTLIKLILGHLYPTTGRLSVLGKDPRDVETKFRIGYLPERSYLYKNLTAEETLAYFGEILNLSREQIESRTDQLLEMVGLNNSRRRFVGEFSHGMTRRMGLAQALLNDPDFIILDEPTAGLDPIGCREVKDLIITLGKRGKTVLLTSHLLADVEDTCSEIVMMFGGTIQSRGRVDEILADTNRLRLEFPAVSRSNLTEIENIIKQKTASSDLVISSPKQSLETYFLNVVQESSTRQETAGAQQGKGVAAYLQDSKSPKAEVEAPAIKPEAPVSIPVPAQVPVVAIPAPAIVEDLAPVPEPTKSVEVEPIPEVPVETPVAKTELEPVVESPIEIAEIIAPLVTEEPVAALVTTFEDPFVRPVVEEISFEDEKEDVDEDFLDNLRL